MTIFTDAEMEAQSPFPPDWYFVECIGGTINWWDKVHHDIQGSSWTGQIYPSSLAPRHTSFHLLLSSLAFRLIIFYLLPVLWPQPHSGPQCSHLEPLYLTVTLVSGSLFRCHLLGKFLVFLCMYLIYCSSSNKGKLREGLQLSCLPLYSLNTYSYWHVGASQNMCISEQIDEWKQACESSGHVSLAPCHWWGCKHSAGCAVST